MSARFDRSKVPHEIYDMREQTSPALDAAIPEDEIESFLDDIYDTNIDGRPETVRLYIAHAIGRFLDAVENSQQPISHDAMQTLRAHLECRCP